MTKISVGIPVYNQGEYLAQAIESVLHQTIKPFEIIVCNDGSKDNSLQVAKSYESQGVKVVNQVNKGLSSARNTLIMNSSGSYFLPLDADDMMMGNCIERVTQVIEQTRADIVAPSFKEFGISNNSVILGSNPTLEEFKTGNRIGYFSAIKRTTLLEVGGYNPKMTYGWEDWDLWIDLLKRGNKLVTIPETLILYRVKSNSMYTDSLKHSESLLTQMQLNHPEV